MHENERKQITVNLYESPIFYRECTNGLSSESKRPLVNYPFSTLITDHNELCLNCIDTDVLQDIPCIRAFTSFYGDQLIPVVSVYGERQNVEITVEGYVGRYRIGIMPLGKCLLGQLKYQIKLLYDRFYCGMIYNT